MTQYVLTYVSDNDSLLMVRKKRPKWQAGKLNFPGGHIEEGEEPLLAAARELFEETGLLAKHLPYRGKLTVNHHEVFVYHAIHLNGPPIQKTDEELVKVARNDLIDREDLVDYNIVIMDGLINSDINREWDIIHHPHGYSIQIPGNVAFDKH